MPEIPKEEGTVEAIYEALRKQGLHSRRRSERIGASAIGEECRRRTWYDYRWASPMEEFEGRTIRIFRRGDVEEDLVVKDLESAGIHVMPLDPNTMKQWEFTNENGHFVAKLDGIAQNVPEAPKTWHSLEVKSMNEKRFKALVKKGLESAEPKYYWQCIAGMHFSGKTNESRLTRCLFIAVNKNNEEIFVERLKYVAEQGKKIERLALDLTTTTDAPPKAGSGPDVFPCRFCPHTAVCHTKRFPTVSCRTCAFSEPVAAGGWYCHKHEKELSRDERIEACDKHVYLQTLVPWLEPVEMDRDAPAILFRDEETEKEFWNGPSGRNSYPSRELERLEVGLIGDEVLDEIRGQFNASVDFSRERPDTCPTGDPARPFNDDIPF